MTTSGVNVVVAVNMFSTDSETELNAVRSAALAAGAFDAVVCTHHAHGGKGAVSHFFMFANFFDFEENKEFHNYFMNNLGNQLLPPQLRTWLPNYLDRMYLLGKSWYFSLSS